MKIKNDYKKLIKDREKYKKMYCESDFVTNNAIKDLFKMKYGKRECNFKSINVVKIVIDKYVNAIIGSGYDISIPEDKNKEEFLNYIKKNNIEQSVKDSVGSMLYYGFSFLRIYERGRDGLILARETPQGNIRPIGSIGLGEKLNDYEGYAIVYQEKDDDSKTQTIIQEYRYIEGGVSENKYISKELSMFDMDVDRDIKGKELIESNTLEDMPIFVFNNDKSCNTIGISESEITSFKDLVDELAIQVSIVSNELIDNSKSKLSIPNSIFQSMEENGLVVDGYADVFGQDYFVNSGDGKVEYAQKDPSYVDREIEWIEKILGAIASVSLLPPTSLGVSSVSANETATLTESRNQDFVDSVNSKRRNIKFEIERLYTILYKRLYPDTNDIYVTINFSDLSNYNYKNSDIISAKESEIIDAKTAGRLMFGFDDKQFEEIDKAIANAKAIQSNINTDFSFTNTIG